MEYSVIKSTRRISKKDDSVLDDRGTLDPQEVEPSRILILQFALERAILEPSLYRRYLKS